MKNKGWSAKVDLSTGILKTYDWFIENQNQFKEVKL